MSKFLFDTAATINVQIKSVQLAVSAFDADFELRRAAILAYQYRFAHHYLSGAGNVQDLVDALTERQVPAANNDKGENACLPIIRILAGHFDESPTAKPVRFGGKEGLKPFVRNESWSKYAGVLRHLYQRNIHPDEAEAFILNFSGKLAGILAADRKRNSRPRTSANEAHLTNAKARARQSSAVPVLGASTDNGFRMVWAYVENGQAHVGSVVPNSEARAKAAAATYVIQNPEAIARTAEELAADRKQAAAMADLRATVGVGSEEAA